jgi:hypothetical protein
MADIPPPNALYPQPVSQNQGLLSGDPTKVIGLIGQMNANALWQQQFNARKAIGKSYQDAIQPDGSIDTNTLMQSIKNNPDAGFMAGEAASGALSRQGQQIENATKMFGLQAGQNRVLFDGIGALAAKPVITDEDLRNAAVTWARNSGVPTANILSVVSSAPKDQAARHDWVKNIQNIAMGSAATASRISGPPTGGGAPTTMPIGGAGYSDVGGAAPAPGTISTGLSPAASATNTRSGEAYSSASEGAGSYANRVNPLRQAIPILEGMKETDIGPISDKWNEIKSTAVNLGAGPLLGIDPTKIRDVNELKKYFNQYSVQAGATLGPHTNDGLAAAVTSNPNIHMDRMSALDLSKVALGVERMRQAGVLEFKSKVDRGDADPSQFNNFMVDWGTKQDPRAFVYDLMTKDQQDKLKKTLPPTELKKIRDGMNIADRHGLLGDVHSQ